MKFLLSLCCSMILSLGLWAQAKPLSKSAPKPVAAKPKTTAAKPKTSTKGKTATKSKKSNSSKLNTSGDMEFEELICYEDGPCTFTIVRKDTLVYEVNAAGKQYDLFIIPNKFESSSKSSLCHFVFTSPVEQLNISMYRQEHKKRLRLN